MGYLLKVCETIGKEDTAVKGMLVIESLPQAFEVLGEVGVSGQKWEGDYREAGREALKGILEGRMSSYLLIGGLRRFVFVGVWIVAMAVFPGTY